MSLAVSSIRFLDKDDGLWYPEEAVIRHKTEDAFRVDLVLH